MFTFVYSVILWKRYFNYDASKDSVVYFLDYDKAKEYAEKKANELFAGQSINYDKKTHYDGGFDETWYGSNDWYEMAVELNNFAWATDFRCPKDAVCFHDECGLSFDFDSNNQFLEFIEKSSA